MIVKRAWTDSNITIPQGKRWFAQDLPLVDAEDSLTVDAREVLRQALRFPHFQVPGVDEMLELHRDQIARSKSAYRPFGRVRIKKAISELGAKGYYGIRRASLGRRGAGDDNRIRLAFARSYANEPHKHLQLLEALTDDQIRDYDQATRAAWARYRATGHFLLREGNVVSLADRRLGRTG